MAAPKVRTYTTGLDEALCGGKRVRISAPALRIEPLSKEDVEAVGRAVEEVERRAQQKRGEIAEFDSETLETLGGPSARLTWVDSLYVAAALARETAGVPVSRVAGELEASGSREAPHAGGDRDGSDNCPRLQWTREGGFRAKPPAWLSAGCERQLAELEDRLERAGEALEEVLRAL
ncbi:MAG: regulator [Thermoproteaceae archaeon]|nr:regulator [Thermoproteaceae archaeon]